MKKIAFVTGGVQGIGLATAQLLQEQGYRVAVSYLSNHALAEKFKNQHKNALVMQADMSIEAEVKKCFERIEAKFGKVSLLVNNAGGLQKQMKVEMMDEQRINAVLKQNITSSFLCAKYAILQMAKCYGGDGGSIVNLSSRASQLGGAFEYVDYAASKGAIDSFTIGLAKELAGQNIRVNAVAPGLIDTAIHAKGGEAERIERLKKSVPMQRGGSAKEVAELIVWLTSNKASYITGAIIPISGGR